MSPPQPVERWVKPDGTQWEYINEKWYPAKKASAYQIGGDHYSSMKIQPIDYIRANDLGYIEGNIIKYISRYKKKDGLKDLKKAKQYIEFLIESNKDLN